MSRRRSDELQRLLAGDRDAIVRAVEAHAELIDLLWQSALGVHGELDVRRADFADRLVRSIARLAIDSMSVDPSAGMTAWDDLAGALKTEDLYLATACARGCPRAWQLFERHYGKLIRAVIRSTRVSLSVADVEADLLAGGVKGGGRIASYRGEGSLVGWLEIVVKRRCIAWRQQQRAPDRWADVGCDGYLAPPPPRDPARVVSRAEESQALERALVKALEELEAVERRILRRVFFLGQTQKTVAREIGWSEVQLCRRLQKLSRGLSERVAHEMRSFGGAHGWCPSDDQGRRLGESIEHVLRDEVFE